MGPETPPRARSGNHCAILLPVENGVRSGTGAPPPTMNRLALVLLLLGAALLGLRLLRSPTLEAATTREVTARAVALGATVHGDEVLRRFRELSPGGGRSYDPLAGFVLNPDREWETRWLEHPAGRFVKVTNERGLLRREPTPLVAEGPRILVLGDSHTEGVVATEENYPFVLESLLDREPEWKGVEVLNAGVGNTGPHLYLGMLYRHLELRPERVIATVFTGNDFWDDLHVSYLLAEEPIPNPGPAYYEPLNEVRDLWPQATWQGLNQIYRFRSVPGERERALAAVLESFERMRALCEAEGIALTVAILPTKFDTEKVIQRLAKRCFDRLGLEREAAGDNARLGAELAGELAARGIDVVDLLPALRAEREPCYWVRDHHLSLHGHAVVARVLAEHLRSLER